jgi:metallophosphoesterase (TIGR00282 family)
MKLSSMRIVRAAMIGDVVGNSGLAILEKQLPGIIKEYALDFVSVNGENADEGFGLTEASLRRILGAGADVVTTGNHVWEKREFWPLLDSDRGVLRPANYAPGSPGRGSAGIEKNGASWVIMNLQGRECMTPIDCPFRCFDSLFADLQSGGGSSLVLVDFHAESTREKEALGMYLDGRASLVAGTHTHVQTADERILPGGTAYITDLGMTGITRSVIGMDPKICLDRVRKQVLFRMEVAGGEQQSAAVQGIVAEFDADSGKGVSIKRINCFGEL